MAERREKNTLYERKSKRKGRETNMLGNDQESYRKLKKKKTSFVRKQEETVEGGMGRKKGNVKQKMSPLLLGSRELQRAEQVTGTKHLGCRLSCGSGTMGEGEPR